MVEDDLPASRLKRLRVGRILDLGPDLEEAEHRLHVDERLAHLAVDEAEEIERDVELDEVGVDQHEVADRHPPGDDPRSGHHHDDREPHRDDRRLADVEERERHLALDRGALVAREGLLVAPRLVRLVAEVLDRLVVEQAVDRLGIRLLVALVHPAPVLGAPLGDGEGEGDVARDGDEGDEGEPEIEERPQDAADEADLDEGRQDVEEHEAERELDPRRPPLDRAHHAAGAAVEMEAQCQAVEMHEGAERHLPDGARRDLGEDRVPELAEDERHHAREAVGEDNGDRHAGSRHCRRRDVTARPLAQAVDRALVEHGHVDVAELGGKEEEKGRHHPRLELGRSLGPEVGQERADRAPGVRGGLARRGFFWGRRHGGEGNGPGIGAPAPSPILSP